MHCHDNNMSFSDVSLAVVYQHKLHEMNKIY
jgi:hypothetical protein